jgi:hypothetical protein
MSIKFSQPVKPTPSEATFYHIKHHKIMPHSSIWVAQYYSHNRMKRSTQKTIELEIPFSKNIKVYFEIFFRSTGKVLINEK